MRPWDVPHHVAGDEGRQLSLIAGAERVRGSAVCDRVGVPIAHGRDTTAWEGVVRCPTLTFRSITKSQPIHAWTAAADL